MKLVERLIDADRLIALGKSIGKKEDEMKIEVGSLFDGIGGAPLSAVLSGAEPVWASEIEKVPTSITKRHFPNMKHYGDITQINGAEIEPVDIIVGGSPCQDLSVAGKRAGLEGERSGLFMDQVRIVKEMRNATRRQTGNGSDKLPRPRYMVWENVPGAFSSNKGEDFRAVLEETAKVADPTISIPRSVNGWANAGSILADRFSISWRTFDAQYWGVPQRRRRIYLVADFGGQSAPEILFEQESVSRDITESRSKGQGAAEDAERRVGSAGAYGLVSKGNGEAFLMEEKHMSLSCGGGQAGQGYPAVVERRTDDARHAVCYDGESITSPTNRQNPKPGDPCHTLGTDSRNYVCYGISSYASNAMKSSNPHSGIYEAEHSGPQIMTKVARGPSAIASPEQKYLVRRLTPLECERLQGYPDGWTALDHEDKAVSDTQRYKALGNSFAVPNALFVISRCVKQLQKGASQ